MGQLDEDVGLDVDGRAGGEGVEVRSPIGQGKNGNGDGLAVEVGDGQADAFNGDRTFVDHPGTDVLGDADFEGPVGGLAVEVRARPGMTGSRAEFPAAVDVALDDVSAEGTAGGGGQFEVDFGSGGEGAEGGLVEGFLGEVGVEEVGSTSRAVRQTPETARESPSRRRPARPGASTVMRRTPPRDSRLRGCRFVR